MSYYSKYIKHTKKENNIRSCGEELSTQLQIRVQLDFHQKS